MIDAIYTKFIRDCSNNRFKNIKEIADISKYIKINTFKYSNHLWYA